MTGKEPPPPPTYARYSDFLDEDPRRRGNALELGHDWRDGDERYRVCWYEETGELTSERLAADAVPDLDDFHQGVAGPVEVLALLSKREDLEALMGRWPHVAPNQPRTLHWLRELARGRNPSATETNRSERV